jgi:hypothetical protein
MFPTVQKMDLNPLRVALASAYQVCVSRLLMNRNVTHQVCHLRVEFVEVTTPVCNSGSHGGKHLRFMVGVQNIHPDIRESIVEMLI